MSCCTIAAAPMTWPSGLSYYDHPFQHWKQADLRGLASVFGGVHSDLRGVRDAENDQQPSDRRTREPVAVDPKVPFCPELLLTRTARTNSFRPGSSTPGTPALPAIWSIGSGRPCIGRTVAGDDQDLNHAGRGSGTVDLGGRLPEPSAHKATNGRATHRNGSINP
jgi:hypothetical protein